MGKRVGMISLGCAKNQVNAEQMLYRLQQAGYTLQEDVDGADLVIVNTCGFIDSAKSEAIDNILAMGALKQEGRIGRLLVTGCLSQRYQDEILQEMPEELPDRLEAGTHNMPGIAGLLEGLRFVEQQGVGRIAGHERHLTRHMAALLRDIPGAEVFYTPEDGAQTGVLSFRLDGWDCEALGEALAAQGAAVRAGLHCAPLAHRTAGTLETGTVRCSFSAFSTTAQVEHFVRILRQIVR